MGKKEGLRFDVVFRMTFTVILKYFLQGQYNHIWLRELNIYLKHFKFIWYKYDIWYKMLQKQCFSSHYCMEATGAPRNAYVFQKHIIYREQKLGPHWSLDTHFLIHQEKSSVVQRFGNEWLRHKLYCAHQILLPLNPNVKSNDQSHWAHQYGTDLQPPSELSGAFCLVWFGLNSPACVNVMWTFKWLLMAWQRGKYAVSGVLLVCIYLFCNYREVALFVLCQCLSWVRDVPLAFSLLAVF